MGKGYLSCPEIGLYNCNKPKCTNKECWRSEYARTTSNDQGVFTRKRHQRENSSNIGSVSICVSRGLRDDLWIGLVLFVDGQKPTKYLFPSTVWNKPNQLFTDTAVKNPEYGINLNQHTMKEFVEGYAFEKMIKNL